MHVYREWMEFELELSMALHKPMIVVRPDPAIAYPMELRAYSRGLCCEVIQTEEMFRQTEMLLCGHDWLPPDDYHLFGADH